MQAKVSRPLAQDRPPAEAIAIDNCWHRLQTVDCCSPCQPINCIDTTGCQKKARDCSLGLGFPRIGMSSIPPDSETKKTSEICQEFLPHIMASLNKNSCGICVAFQLNLRQF